MHQSGKRQFAQANLQVTMTTFDSVIKTRRKGEKTINLPAKRDKERTPSSEGKEVGSARSGSSQGWGQVINDQKLLP